MKYREVVAVLLAIAIVGSAIIVMEYSLKGRLPHAETEPYPEKTSRGLQPNQRENGTESYTTSDTTTLVTKCTIQGRTVYSDTDCKGKNSEVVVLHDTRGIVGPSQEVINATLERHREEQRAMAAQLKPVVAQVNSTGQQHCDQVKAQIESLQRRARMPQTAATQDWIKQEIYKLQKHGC